MDVAEPMLQDVAEADQDRQADAAQLQVIDQLLEIDRRGSASFVGCTSSARSRRSRSSPCPSGRCRTARSRRRRPVVGGTDAGGARARDRGHQALFMWRMITRFVRAADGATSCLQAGVRDDRRRPIARCAPCGTAPRAPRRRRVCVSTWAFTRAPSASHGAARRARPDARAVADVDDLGRRHLARDRPSTVMSRASTLASTCAFGPMRERVRRHVDRAGDDAVNHHVFFAVQVAVDEQAVRKVRSSWCARPPVRWRRRGARRRSRKMSVALGERRQ